MTNSFLVFADFELPAFGGGSLARVDLSERFGHLFSIFLSLIQPVLLASLVLGFVLISAHLLVMLGTRWGDRRVTSKAFLFSLGLHLSMGCGIVAMIPEIRSKVLHLPFKDEPAPIRIQTAGATASAGSASLADPQRTTNVSGGRGPVWSRTPEAVEPDRSRTEAALPESSKMDSIERHASAGDSTPLRELPETPYLPPPTASLPDARVQMVPTTEDPIPQNIADAPLVANSIPGERRTEFVPGPAADSRTRSSVSGNKIESNVYRPTPGNVDRIRPEFSAKRNEAMNARLEPSSVIPKAEVPSAEVIRREGPDLAGTGIGAVGTLAEPAPDSGREGMKSSSGTGSSGGSVKPEAEATGRQPSRTARTTGPATTDQSITRPRTSGGNGTGDRPGRFNPTESLAARSGGGGDGLPLASIERPGAARPDGIGDGFGSQGGPIPGAYEPRRPDMRGKAVQQFGGSKETEAAVDRSLRWLASVQTDDGYWDASAFEAGQLPKLNGVPAEERSRVEEMRETFKVKDADAGVTALTVLAFLGKLNTVDSGPYSENVERALRWLVKRQRADGFLGSPLRPNGRQAPSPMYSHAMATFALAEAYALSKDSPKAEWMKAPLMKAAQFTLDNRLDDGGWRYEVGQPYGDMSIFGWHMMSLKSVETAGVPVPATVRAQMVMFLREHGIGRRGGLASYRANPSRKYTREQFANEKPSAAMTAEALFCRMVLGGARDSLENTEAVEYLLERLPNRASMNYYYWYYGTLAMFQVGGDPWEKWNQRMRDLLLSEQRADGPMAGSWDAKDPWGVYGGRIYSTALATLCLEVYYRYPHLGPTAVKAAP